MVKKKQIHPENDPLFDDAFNHGQNVFNQKDDWGNDAWEENDPITGMVNFEDPHANNEDTNEGTGTNSGGDGTKVEFVDFLSSTIPNKALDATTEKTLLRAHQHAHKQNAFKRLETIKAFLQNLKNLRNQRQQKKTSVGIGYGIGNGLGPGMPGQDGGGQYLPNPAFAHSSQFTIGIDKNTNPAPENTDNNPNAANSDQRASSEAEYRLIHQPQLRPGYHNTPTLRKT